MPGPFDYAAPLAQAEGMPQPQEGASILQGINQGLQLRMAGVQNAFQMQQIQRQLTLQQQQDAAQRTALSDPTPENIQKWQIAAPEQWQATQAAHNSLNTDTQRTNMQDAAAVYGLLGAGNTDGAAKILQNRVDAGQSHLQPLLDMVQSGDPNKVKQAQGVAGMTLASYMGPDQFANAYGTVTKTPSEIGLAQAQAKQASALAEAALHPPAKTAAVEGQLDANGNPIFYNVNAPPPAAPLPADLQGWAAKMDAAENATGNPGAKNPNSTATGNGQFINGTWLQMVKSVRSDLASGKTDDQILALRSSPGLSQQVTAAYAQVNGHALQAAGMPVNGATLALAHRFGPQGAQTVLQADPNAKLADVLPKAVIAANPDLKGVTAGQYAQHLATQFGTDPITVGTNASDTAALTGDAFLKTLAPARANLIRAIANGDQAAPTGRAAASGPGAVLLQQVLQYDPTASAINLPARKATREDFTSGASAKAINSINTVTGHLVGLDKAIDDLQNTGVPMVNEAAQAVGKQFDTATQKRLAQFNFYKGAVANELTKVFRGSNGAESDIKGWMSQLEPDESPVALHQTVQSMVHGMMSRLQALGAQYSQGMGKTTDPLQLVTPQTAKALNDLGAPAPVQNSQVTAVNPQTGQRIAYDPVTRMWKAS